MRIESNTGTAVINKTVRLSTAELLALSMKANSIITEDESVKELITFINKITDINVDEANTELFVVKPIEYAEAH